VKKPVKIILIVVPCVIVIGLIVGYIFLGAAVKTAVEKILPPILGTEVKVQEVDLALLSGRVEINGLMIGNPEGFNTDSSFELTGVRVKFVLSSVFTDTVHIEEIYIDAPMITYEVGFGESNISTILENVKKLSGPEEKETEEKKSGGKKVIIDNFIMKNGKVRLAIKGVGPGVPLPLLPIHIKDIGKEKKGATAGEAVAKILGPINNVVEDIVKGAGKLFEAGTKGLGKAATGAGKGLKTGTKNLMDGATNIFKKKEKK